MPAHSSNNMSSYSRPRHPSNSRHPSPSSSLCSPNPSPRNWSLPRQYHRSQTSSRTSSRSSSRSSSRGRRSCAGSTRSSFSGSDDYSRGRWTVPSVPLHAESAARPMLRTGRVGGIKRWDGTRRMTTDWDSIRKDPELWFAGGDCLVHFYARGQSRRGPSLRLMFADIEASNCRPLLEYASASPVREPSPTAMESGTEDYVAYPSHELYIPAPAHLNREEAFAYHLTTRNFFAWMFEQPLVGDRLGDVLVMLLERMHEWRPDSDENQDDLLAYIDGMGYTDFREYPDHALAVLYFAEKFHSSELWTDAFVHSVGMNARLAQCHEFVAISRTTKALITRAKLEMDLRLERAGASLANFLEDEPTLSLELSLDAQKHLERFRSFLTSFYVQRHGYWPPVAFSKKTSALPKTIIRNLYFDFRNLYDYLVDANPFDPPAAMPSTDVPLLHHIVAFDHRNKYASLPHCLPLLPDLPSDVSHPLSPPIQPSRSFALFPKKHARLEQRRMVLGALTAATNSHAANVMDCALVRAYCRFERDWTVETTERTPLSPAAARKLRWLLIYAILQILVSVTRAPTEVRDTELVSYHLCCQTVGTPPWAFFTPPPPPSQALQLRVGQGARVGRAPKGSLAPDFVSNPSLAKSSTSLHSLPSVSSKSMAASTSTTATSTRSRSRSIFSRLLPMSSVSSMTSNTTTVPPVPPKPNSISDSQCVPQTLALSPREILSSVPATPPTPTFSIRTNTTASNDVSRSGPWRGAWAGFSTARDRDASEMGRVTRTPSLADDSGEGPGPSMSAADVAAGAADEDDFTSWLGHRVEGEMGLERVGGKLTMVPKHRTPQKLDAERTEDTNYTSELSEVIQEKLTDPVASPRLLPAASTKSLSVPAPSKSILRGRSSKRNLPQPVAEPPLPPSENFPPPKGRMTPKSAEGMERLHRLGVARRERGVLARRRSAWANDASAESDIECDYEPRRTSPPTSRRGLLRESPSNVFSSDLDDEVEDLDLGDGGLDAKLARERQQAATAGGGDAHERVRNGEMASEAGGYAAAAAYSPESHRHRFAHAVGGIVYEGMQGETNVAGGRMRRAVIV